MAESILRITTTLESRILFDKTNAEVAQILEWFIANITAKMPQGLTQAEQNKWKLEQAHRKMIRMVMQEAAANRHNMKRNAQPDLYAEALAETTLADNMSEPEPEPAVPPQT